jgi:hypothetical protein
MSTVRLRSMTTALTAPPSWPILTGDLPPCQMVRLLTVRDCPRVDRRAQSRRYLVGCRLWSDQRVDHPDLDILCTWLAGAVLSVPCRLPGPGVWLRPAAGSRSIGSCPCTAQNWPFLDRCLHSAGDAAGPAGAPRSEARTNDLEVRRDDGHTRPRGRPGPRTAREAPAPR